MSREPERTKDLRRWSQADIDRFLVREEEKRQESCVLSLKLTPAGRHLSIREIAHLVRMSTQEVAAILRKHGVPGSD